MSYNYRSVNEVGYNWFYSNEVGEKYQRYVADGSFVKEIQYHSSDEHDKTHYCDVVFSDGCVQRIFNINYVKFI